MKPGSYRRIRLSFSVLAWSGAGWALSFFMVYFLKDDPLRLFWGRMGFATSGIIPSAFLMFAFLFPREQKDISLTKTIIFGCPALLFLILSFTDQIVSSLGLSSKMFNYGPFYPFFSIYLTGFMILGFLFLDKNLSKNCRYRKAPGEVLFIGNVLYIRPCINQ